MQLKLALLIGVCIVGAYTANTCSCGPGDVYKASDNTCNAADPAVDNCEIYQRTASKCQQCKEDYYLSTGKCLKYETEVENCLRYSAKDKCSICKVGYYKKDATHCVENPTTEEAGEVADCKTYMLIGGSDKPNCTGCSEGKFVYNKKCVDLPANCLQGQTDKKCTTCEKGYYANKDAVCTENPSDIDSCIKYAQQGDKVVCQFCDTDKVLKTVEGKQTCADVDTKVDDCFFYTYSDADKKSYCQACNPNFFDTTTDNHITACTECPFKPGFGALLQFGLALVALVALLF